MKVLLDEGQVLEGLRRIAEEIVERHGGTDKLLLVGIRRGGLRMMELVAELIQQQSGTAVETGTLDITLYRDDAATALPSPRLGPSEMPGDVNGLRVVLIDDVLQTRRTIRAAIDAVLDFGRPQNIELAVLVDRAGRQLPIQPDYRVIRVEDIGPTERVDVIGQGSGLQAVIQPNSAPSIPPPGY